MQKQVAQTNTNCNQKLEGWLDTFIMLPSNITPCFYL
jgi:hypothetical protein